MQNFTAVTDDMTLAASLLPIVNNIKSVLSNFSGTAFPTANLEVGMWCHRTDENRLYQLTGLPGVWTLRFDFTKGVATITDSVSTPAGVSELFAGTDWNELNTTGFYRGSNKTNAPSTGWYNVTCERHDSNHCSQLATLFASPASGFATGDIFSRVEVNGVWSAWKEVWTAQSLTNLNQLTNGPGYITSLLGALLNANGQVIDNAKLQSWRETVVTANAGTTYAIDLAVANVYNLTLTANTAFTLTNPAASASNSVVVALKQDATGSRVPTYPATVKWPGGTVFTPTATAGKTDFVTFVTLDGGTSWFGFPGARNF